MPLGKEGKIFLLSKKKGRRDDTGKGKNDVGEGVNLISLPLHYSKEGRP